MEPYYEILGVAHDASMMSIYQSYREKLQENYLTQESKHRVITAYNVLKCPERRVQHDARIRNLRKRRYPWKNPEMPSKASRIHEESKRYYHHVINLCSPSTSPPTFKKECESIPKLYALSLFANTQYIMVGILNVVN